MPKPRSRHKYCGVCRGHYEDYKDHIESELHLAHLKNSRYQEMMVQLSGRFQQLVEKREKEEPIVVDLTTEEAVVKITSEMTETANSIKGATT